MFTSLANINSVENVSINLEEQIHKTGFPIKKKNETSSKTDILTVMGFFTFKSSFQLQYLRFWIKVAFIVQQISATMFHLHDSRDFLMPKEFL